MKTLAERIATLMAETGETPTTMAVIAGVKPPSVIDWLNGKTKSLKSAPALRLAEHFGVSMLWLTEGIGMMRADDQAAPKLINLREHEDLHEIPRVHFKLSAGVSGFAIEPEAGNGKPVFFRRDWFEAHGYNPAKMFAVRVNGASMETALWDGDLVVVNTADTRPIDGECFAINYEGEMCIKRLRRDAGEWWATSDNADQRRFSPKRCTEDVIIVGRVVYKQSDKI